MKLKNVLETLNTVSPFDTQASWDNSGLIVDDLEQEVSHVILSIDIDEALLDEVAEGTLIVTHHPLIFGGVKSLDYAAYPSRLLVKMVEKNISNIAMHTNFDLSHLNRYVVEKVIGEQVVEVGDYLLYFNIEEDFKTYAKYIAKVFALSHVKAVKGHERVIKRVALCTGSGASMIKEVKADLFLTGDIKYHDAMEAKSLGLNMIDIGHFESERFFGEILVPYLKNLGLTVIISSSKNPFTYL